MAKAADLRSEAQLLRDQLQETTDPMEVAELQAFIDELERLARLADNGDASPESVTLARDRGWLKGQAPPEVARHRLHF